MPPKVVQEEPPAPPPPPPPPPKPKDEVTGLPLEIQDLPTGLHLIVRPLDVLEKLWTKGADVKVISLTLGSLLGFKDLHKDFRAQILLEYYFQCLTYAFETCLTPMKGAVFLAIVSVAIERMKETSKRSKFVGDIITVDECFDIFQELLLRHSVGGAAALEADLKAGNDKLNSPSRSPSPSPPAPKGTMEVFSQSDAKLLTDFVYKTLFMHYKLYQYCIIFPREVERVDLELLVEEPFPPPPLLEGTLVAGSKDDLAPRASGSKDGSNFEGADRPGTASATAAATNAPTGSPTPAPPGTAGSPKTDGLGPKLDPELEAFLDSKLKDIASKLDQKISNRQQVLEEKLAEMTKKK